MDLQLPDGNGLELISEIRAILPQCQFIVLTGFGTIEAAIQATKMGAYHFLTKPFNLEELVILVDKHLNTKDFLKKILT